MSKWWKSTLGNANMWRQSGCVQFGSSLPHSLSLRSRLWIFLFNSSVFSFPSLFFLVLNQEIKCDFHVFTLSLLGTNVICTPLCIQSTGQAPGALELMFLNADWLEGARFVTSPAPVCRHFNYHRESRPFSCFGQLQGLAAPPALWTWS